MNIDILLAGIIGYCVAFPTAWLLLKNTSSGLGRPPKPPKRFVCPHGNIATQKQYIIGGQKRLLCNYCYNKTLEETGELPLL